MTYMCNGLWGSNNFGIMYNDNVYKSMTIILISFTWNLKIVSFSSQFVFSPSKKKIRKPLKRSEGTKVLCGIIPFF